MQDRIHQKGFQEFTIHSIGGATEGICKRQDIREQKCRFRRFETLNQFFWQGMEKQENRKEGSRKKAKEHNLLRTGNKLLNRVRLQPKGFL